MTCKQIAILLSAILILAPVAVSASIFAEEAADSVQPAKAPVESPAPAMVPAAEPGVILPPPSLNPGEVYEPLPGEFFILGFVGGGSLALVGSFIGGFIPGIGYISGHDPGYLAGMALGGFFGSWLGSMGGILAADMLLAPRRGNRPAMAWASAAGCAAGSILFYVYMLLDDGSNAAFSTMPVAALAGTVTGLMGFNRLQGPRPSARASLAPCPRDRRVMMSLMNIGF